VHSNDVSSGCPGIMAITMYGFNYVGGLLAFGTSMFAPEFKAWYVSYHRPLGEVAYIFLVAAIISGITEVCVCSMYGVYLCVV
jgi:hypothetical protein